MLYKIIWVSNDLKFENNLIGALKKYKIEKTQKKIDL